MRSRNNAVANLSQNIDTADASWFVDAANGDLHLSSCDITELSGQGTDVSMLNDDYDHHDRDSNIDIGADQCVDIP